MYVCAGTFDTRLGFIKLMIDRLPAESEYLKHNLFVNSSREDGEWCFVDLLIPEADVLIR